MAGRRISSVVLLGGSIRPTALTRAIDRSILDLPIGGQETVLDLWLSEILRLGQRLGVRRLDVRLLLAAGAQRPATRPRGDDVSLTVQIDPQSFRGTGGLLRDALGGFKEDEFVLVANAAQILRQPLAEIVPRMMAHDADVCLAAHDHGTLCGLFLLRAGCLRSVPSVGYIDLKEQVLPELARVHSVAVLRSETPPGLPIRTRASYLQAMTECHAMPSDGKTGLGPFRENWMPAFGIVEPGADVAPSARIHDSVVLRGARVAPGAILVRCVVCHDARVPTSVMIVDRVVQGTR